MNGGVERMISELLLPFIICIRERLRSMLSIKQFSCENLQEGCITDKQNPSFSYYVESDVPGTIIKNAHLEINDWSLDTTEQIAIEYQGNKLQPFKTYEAYLQVEDNHGQKASSKLTFETGRLDTPWAGQWITDGTYHFKEKKVSPKPMLFRKKFNLKKELVSAKLYATALGIYQCSVNGQSIGEDYFTPGFTSYKTNLQYQVYDILDKLQKENQLDTIVTGGWAVGSFGMTRKNRITAKRQALLAEIHLHYRDGSTEVIKTDNTWEVTCHHAVRMADLYDGETYDARFKSSTLSMTKAMIEDVKIKPKISATYGSLVRAHETLNATKLHSVESKNIFDFGQNFAGVIKIKIKKAKAGQKLVIRHAEILKPNGDLNTDFLRTAKATITYICSEGDQEYSPKFTYMGFRYISIEGMDPTNYEVEGIVLYSDIKQIGHFETSNPLLNQLQSNIVWSSKSNFMDIPTDCPQRDERMGWTGDIALFAPTANFNFNLTRFIDKWLVDVKNEQASTGGLPNTVPSQGFGFPETMPTMAIDFWGDASVLVPWAEYQARGDKRVLQRFYPMMKKYVRACLFWANLLSFGKSRYIWHTPSIVHFGDWVAPDVPKMSQWQKRSKWTATASLYNTSRLVSMIANILDHEEDAKEFYEISEKTADAYESILTDGKGKLLNEFQTAYVLPIHYRMFKHENQSKAVENLVKLVENNEYRIGTGFPGTPYILFALTDNGRADVAYKMLLNTLCPSWLYQVKMGATTIWERWDGLDENGNCPINDDGTDMMISYNHYASGAVGDFMYQRIAGIEAIEAGYRHFKVEPIIGGNLNYAKAEFESPYGIIRSNWKIKQDQLILKVEVPVGATSDIYYKKTKVASVGHGCHEWKLTL